MFLSSFLLTIVVSTTVLRICVLEPGLAVFRCPVKSFCTNSVFENRNNTLYQIYSNFISDRNTCSDVPTGFAGG